MLPVRDVVLLVSSSRSGSSMLAELLLQTRQLVMTQGEMNPFFRMVGLPGNGPLNVQPNGQQRSVLTDILAQELGFLTSEVDWEEYKNQIFYRLGMQWPEEKIGHREVCKQIHRTLMRGDTFYDLLMALRHRHRSINPNRYDLPRTTSIGIPKGAPRMILEEPPFIVPRPWRHADTHELQSRTVVIKGPAECYRMEFWRSMFPQARMRVLHLVRNPAAVINGLMDGWRSHNFHSEELPPGTLNILGYHKLEQRIGTDRWWKFDKPPHWDLYRHAPLEHVAFFQWYSAHQHVLRFWQNSDYHRVHFEHLQDSATRTQTLARLFTWLSIDANPMCALPDVVMATEPPMPGRWRKRHDQIMSVVGEGNDLIRELDYERVPWS